MSYPLIPNNSKWQEVEHGNKELGKIMNPQSHSDNSMENMSATQYSQFVENNERERQANIKAERRRRNRANLLLYSAMALGVVSIIVGLIGYDYNAPNRLGWAAIFLGASGAACLARYLIGSYASNFGWKGIIGFCLSVLGVVIGFGALTGELSNLAQ